jgi:hypothetical protein
VNPAYNFAVHKLPNKSSQLFMKKQILSALSILIFTAFTVNAQDVPLEQFLDKAYGETVKYKETFKNLVAEELRTTDYFNKDETLKESRKVKSVFIVYQSAKDNSITEYRNVTEYNGKNVARDDDDVVNFFEKLTNSDSADKEHDRLRNDGFRFDGRFRCSGFTLGQGIPLQKSLREFFEFKVIGKEKVEGRDVLIVEYKQTKPTLLISVRATREELKIKPPNSGNFNTDVSDDFRPTNPRVEGKLWIDAETGQIWRDEYSVIINPATLSKPEVSSHWLNEYQSSDFGILVPKTLQFTAYQIKGKNDKTLTKNKYAATTSTYSKFTNANSEIKDAKTTK